MLTYSSMAGFGPSGLSGATGGYPASSTVCPLCLSHHDEVIVLECGHEFCKSCLNQRLDGNMIKCPSCLKHMDLHDHGLEGLQNNYLINDILKIVSTPDDQRGSSKMSGASPGKAQIDLTQRLSWYTGGSPRPSNATPYCQLCHADIIASKVRRP